MPKRHSKKEKATDEQDDFQKKLIANIPDQANICGSETWTKVPQKLESCETGYEWR